jgi:hypothetical protein
MSTMTAWLAFLSLVAGVTSFAACSASQSRAQKSVPDTTASPAAAPSSSAEAAPASVSLVNATVVVAECPDAKTMNNRTAQAAIHRLVDPCAMVPGGKAHFAATLLPGGRIELAAPSGDPAEGVVPTCVLRHNLLHKVFLKKPCKFDVQLEERRAQPPAAASSSP